MKLLNSFHFISFLSCLAYFAVHIQSALQNCNLSIQIDETVTSEFSIKGFFMLKPYLHKYTTILTFTNARLVNDKIESSISVRKKSSNPVLKFFRLSCQNDSELVKILQCEEKKAFIGNSNPRILDICFKKKSNCFVDFQLTSTFEKNSIKTVISFWPEKKISPNISEEEQNAKLTFEEN